MNIADGFWFGLGFALAVLAVVTVVCICEQFYKWLLGKLRMTPEILAQMVEMNAAASAPPSDRPSPGEKG